MVKLWKNNRVLFMLFIILFICFIAIVCVGVSFFYDKRESEYGPRLKDIDKYPVTEKFQNSYEDEMLKNSGVSEVKFNIKGRVIYVHILFTDDVSLEVAQGYVTESLALFDEKTLSYYDINFVIKWNDDFTIIGSKNSKIDHISWNNNRDFSEDEEVE